MSVEVLSTPVTYGDPAKDPAGTVRVHPDDTPGAASARRIIKGDVTHPNDWPWRRITGLAVDLPIAGTDLSHWPVQPLGDVALALGHAVVLTGREVM